MMCSNWGRDWGITPARGICIKPLPPYRASTEVCVRLADYEKCVRYADGEPVALDALVRQLDAEADQRVAAARPK